MTNSVIKVYRLLTLSIAASAFGSLMPLELLAAPSIVYSFPRTLSGTQTQAALTLGGDGNIYGVYYGDISNCAFQPQVCGNLYRVSPGTPASVTTLLTFPVTASNPISITQAGNGAVAGTLQCNSSVQCFHSGGATFTYSIASGSLSTGNLSGGGFGIVPNEISSIPLLGTTFSCIGTLGSILEGCGFLNVVTIPEGGTVTHPLVALHGTLYGATTDGGASGKGSIFSVSSNGTVTILYSFSGGADGYGPSMLTVASDNNLYGVTRNGGSGNGTIFQFSPGNGQVGHLTTLHMFSGPDGQFPNTPLVEGSPGYLYGATLTGGDPSCGARGLGCGTVFMVSTTGVFTPLDYVQGGNVGNAYNTIALGGDGYLYGLTTLGGDQGAGTIYRVLYAGAALSLTSTGTNNSETASGQVLYSMTVGNNGPSGATNVTVTANVPQGLMLVPSKSTSNCSQSGTILTCSVGTLAAGASSPIALTFQASNANQSWSLSFSAKSSVGNPASDFSTIVITDVSPQDAPLPQWATLVFGLLLAGTTLLLGRQAPRHQA